VWCAIDTLEYVHEALLTFATKKITELAVGERELVSFHRFSEWWHLDEVLILAQVPALPADRTKLPEKANVDLLRR
jgi:hypothetical protein